MARLPGPRERASSGTRRSASSSVDLVLYVSLEDLLVDLRLGLEEFQPTLVVMDSISSIEHASSEKASASS